MLNKVLYPNRWLIWTIVLSNIIAGMLWWAVSLYTIELDREISESEMVYTVHIQRLRPPA